MTTRLKWALAITPPALLGLVFVLLNMGWWAIVFRTSSASGSQGWDIGPLVGTLPVSFPLALLDGWGGVDLITRAPFKWLMASKAGAIFLGATSWGSIGYALGCGISKLLGMPVPAPRWLLWAAAGMALSAFGIFWALIVGPVLHYDMLALFSWPLFEFAAAICFIFAAWGFLKEISGVLTKRFGRPRAGV